MAYPDILIAARFHGPQRSANGGYMCGRVARFIDGPARVRLLSPPPLDTPMPVERRDGGVRVLHAGKVVAEGWPDRFDLEVPPPPAIEAARAASTAFAGFEHHRFPSCFVCGPERAPGEGLRLFVGPVPGTGLVACTWTPAPELSSDGRVVDPEFLWAALDCPGGFSFPHPPAGTILLGELRAALEAPAPVGEEIVVIGWEIRRDGRKHYTGTALFSASGVRHGLGLAAWFEVAVSPDRPPGP